MGGNSLELREVNADDLLVFFAHQQDPIACQQAAFPSRDREAFDRHQARVAQDPKNLRRAIVWNGAVVGNVVSFNRRRAGGRLLAWPGALEPGDREPRAG